MKSILKIALKRFGKFTPIQEKAIPEVLAGRDVLIVAPTGSGKTEAALLPALERLEHRPIGLLYITPLRALNRDITLRIKHWASEIGMRAEVFHGDTSQAERARIKRKPPEILITTPESLQTILGSKRLFPFLRSVRTVIVDEIHELLDSKRGFQLSLGLARLSAFAEFQRIGLSATIGDPEKTAQFLGPNTVIAKIWYPKNYAIEVKRAQTIEQVSRHISALMKDQKVLVFANTRQTAEHLGFILSAVGARVHHSSLAREKREEVEGWFRRSENGAVVATSSLELGIDIGDIHIVVQVGSPRQVSRLVQRIGRSGHRLDKTSKGVIITLDHEDYEESKAIVELFHEGFVEARPILKNAYDVIAHQIAGEVLYEDKTADYIYRLFQRSPLFSIDRQTFDEILNYMARLYLIHWDGEVIRRTKNTRKYYFTNLSTIPDDSKFVVIDNTNRKIGVVDEAFVVELDIGTAFVMQGKTWQVLAIESGKVIVRPSAKDHLVLPSWVGEELPVSPEVAERTAGRIGPGRPVVEIKDGMAAFFLPGGTRACFTGARLLGSALSSVIYKPVQATYDAYRVYLQSRGLRRTHIEKAVQMVLDDPERILNESIVDSSRYLITALHVAKTFGLVERNQRVERRLLRFMKGTIAEKEVLRQVRFKYFDLEHLLPLLERIEIAEVNEFSAWVQRGLAKLMKRERAAPLNSKIVAAMIKEQVMSKEVELECAFCGFRWRARAGELDKRPQCPACKSHRLYVLPYKDDLTADLVASAGRWAIWGLCLRDIGPTTLAAVLRRHPKNDEQFFDYLKEAQERVIKTKAFWK